MCAHISGAVIDKPELLTCFFVKWVFDGSDSLFTPRSLSQVLLENPGATHSRVSFFPPLCVSVVLCVNIILLVTGKISHSLVDSLIPSFLFFQGQLQLLSDVETSHQA